MRVAIFFRGPFRPDLSSGLSRARDLATEVKANGGEPSFFFATWMLEDRAVLRELMDFEHLNHSLIIETPPEPFIYQICGIEHTAGGKPIKNFFYQYYLSKIGLQVVQNMGRFDYVIHTRPDLSVRLGVHYPHWFDAEGYTAFHHKTEHPDSFTNDQFAIATPDVMFSAWNYGTLENLGALIRNARIAEDPLDQMIAAAGVKLRSAPHELWSLDDRRFGPGASVKL